MGTLWNTYAFYVLYAEIDKFNPAEHRLEEQELNVMDRWILSGLNTLVKTVDEGLNEYKITETSRAIAEFVDNLSNWYVRRSRDRFWGSKMTKSKEAAYTTLYTVLATLSKLLAPYVPFMAENIYQNLVRNFDKNAPESVHLCDFPVADEKYINKTLEKGMDNVLKLVVLGRAARNKSNLKNRQPLGRLIYDGKYELPMELKDLVKDELNVKDVQQSADDDSFVSYEIKPQLKTLGPRYGALLGKIRALLAERPQDIIAAIKNRKAMDKLKEEYRSIRGTEEDVKSEFTCEIDGTKIVLSEEDLLITAKNKEGFSSESDGETTVVLDTALTEDLIREGIEREIVSKVQNMRKEAGFEVTDHILMSYVADGIAKDVLDDAKFFSDVLCDGIVSVVDGFTKELDINGHKVVISVKKKED